MVDQTCESGVCGTGTGNFPKPGDPDNNLILSANPGFGGVDVSWTTPGINPHAVAHTIVYRGTSPEFKYSSRLAVVGGNFYFDRTDTATPIEYFYWIQTVSINGTYAGVIGPAQATARPTISELIELLTQKIDQGMLSQSLKTEIDAITLNKLGLDHEILLRAQADDSLGAAFSQVQAHSEGTRALLQEEILARTTADSATVAQVNTLFVEMEDRIAAVQREQEALVSVNEALASDLTTVQSSIYGNSASGQVGLISKVQTVEGKVTSIGALYTAKVNVNGLVGGFGVYNDGKTVEAGFDVDRFWVGRTNSNKRKPFIIENDEVFIDQAAINKLTFSKLRSEDGSLIVENGKMKATYLDLDFAQVRGALQSSNYQPGIAGWKLDKDGTFENNGSTAGEGRTVQNNQGITVYDGGGIKRVQLGKLM